MPQAQTEDATNADHSTGLQVPANGDDSADWAPTVEGAFQQLADRSQAHFLGSLAGDGANTKTFAIRLDPVVNTDDRWAQVENDFSQFYQQASVASAGALIFPLDPLPVGITIVSVFARVQGTGHSALPATMPTITVYEHDVDTYSATQLATFTDDSASVVAYETFHSLTADVATAVQGSRRYHVKITGETGADSEVGGYSITGIFVELGVT